MFPPLTETAEEGVARIFLAFGVSAVAGALIFGKVFDKWGWKPLVVIHLVVVFANYAIIYYTFENRDSIATLPLNIIFVINGFLFGVQESVCNGMVNMTLAEMFSADAKQAFSVYGFTFSASGAIGSFIATLVDYRVLAAIVIAFANMAVIAHIVLRCVLLPRQELLEQSELDELEDRPHRLPSSQRATHPAMERVDGSVAHLAVGAHHSQVDVVTLVSENFSSRESSEYVVENDAVDVALADVRAAILPDASDTALVSGGVAASSSTDPLHASSASFEMPLQAIHSAYLSTSHLEH